MPLQTYVVFRSDGVQQEFDVNFGSEGQPPAAPDPQAEPATAQQPEAQRRR